MGVRRTDGATRRGKAWRDATATRLPSQAADATPVSGQHSWRGISGVLYAHTVTSLIFCPAMAKSTFVLLQRDASGTARVLRVGTLESATPSLNLARIRQLGATLGANEVHVRSGDGTAAERARVAFDIEHALLSGDEAAQAAAQGSHPLA